MPGTLSTVNFDEFLVLLDLKHPGTLHSLKAARCFCLYICYDNCKVDVVDNNGHTYVEQHPCAYKQLRQLHNLEAVFLSQFKWITKVTTWNTEHVTEFTVTTDQAVDPIR